MMLNEGTAVVDFNETCSHASVIRYILCSVGNGPGVADLSGVVEGIIKVIAAKSIIDGEKAIVALFRSVYNFVVDDPKVCVDVLITFEPTY